MNCWFQIVKKNGLFFFLVDDQSLFEIFRQKQKERKKKMSVTLFSRLGQLQHLFERFSCCSFMNSVSETLVQDKQEDKDKKGRNKNQRLMPPFNGGGTNDTFVYLNNANLSQQHYKNQPCLYTGNLIKGSQGNNKFNFSFSCPAIYFVPATKGRSGYVK